MGEMDQGSYSLLVFYSILSISELLLEGQENISSVDLCLVDI